MKLIGLTGSIATGKSTCSSLLSSPPHSLPVIDADLLARKAVEPGTWAYGRIVRTFGPTTPDLLLPPEEAEISPSSAPSSGISRPLTASPSSSSRDRGRPLNRPALGRRVFGSSASKTRDRAKLNAIVHPAVRFYMFRELLCYFVRGHWAVVLDVPLLFESGLDVFVGVIVVVAVSDPQIQMRRLCERDKHLSEEDAKNRVGSQVDVREKAKRAEYRNGSAADGEKDKGRGKGYVVYNDSSRSDLDLQLRDVVGQIRKDSPSWWNWLLLLCPPLVLGAAGWEVYTNWTTKKQMEKERGKELPKAKL